MKYIIGDIHGEYEKLCSLLTVLKKSATEYVFLGDYLDKGRKVKECVDVLIELSGSKKCVFLTGDHEYAWLQYLTGNQRFFDFLLKYGGIQTLESYGEEKMKPEKAKDLLVDKKAVKGILKKHMNFFLKLKFFHEIENEFLCVHGGINPKNKSLPLESHKKEEVVFLRNNFIDSKFLYGGKKIVFGHTAFKEPYVDRYKIGIDTGVAYTDVGYGDLTAFNVAKKEFINHKGEIKTLQSGSV